jgi:DNA-binding XRE family transcriptional regulator
MKNFSYFLVKFYLQEAPMAVGNDVKKIREAQLLSKAELARKAGVSPLTIDRIEKGKDCRMETKRKIILALGYKLTEKDKIFANDK